MNKEQRKQIDALQKSIHLLKASLEAIPFSAVETAKDSANDLHANIETVRDEEQEKSAADELSGMLDTANESLDTAKEG